MRLSARRGLRIRKRSSSNSVEDSEIGSPSRVTSRLALSTFRSPTLSASAAGGVSWVERRSKPRRRATSSSRLNGLVM